MPQPQTSNEPEKDPLWYKDAIIYEAHVRAFQDSNADGMGDFRGLTQRLDYLEDLGITAIWLLPFFPSPWKDDGYDISDFRSVHPAYGSLRDFQTFLREAHRRGLRVITELVINHTSDQHEWFQKSRRAEAESNWRDFYVWSENPDKYSGTRIIFKDFEPSNWSWDPVAKAYYWHRFYAHQPDLNFDNPVVRRTVMRTLDFWAAMGVDGFRLDAIPYLFEREGTSCENLPETHAFLKELRAHIDAHYPNRMLLSEANMWPEDAVAYMGKGDECHMNFHFPLMPRLFMALRLEDRLPIVEILGRTPVIPETCQWAMFLRNHDELTLEMVTEDERDYMYRSYASDRRARINLGIRRRLAPLLQNDRARIEVMNALLFSMPGTPVLYYGDEIGMGDNVFLGDRNGVRTPMQWSPDRNAGFSRANPQQLYLPVNIDPAYHYEAVNVEAQQENPHSLLNWTKRLIALRKKYKAFGRGTLEFVNPPSNRHVLAFVRRYEHETILVVANLSRFAQPVELKLPAYQNCIPVEMLGGTEFPRIAEGPYPLTLGPNSFFWFTVEDRPASVQTVTRPVRVPQAEPPLVYAHGNDIWDAINLPAVASVLPAHIARQPWFTSYDRRMRSVDIVDVIDASQFNILLVRVEYATGDAETYSLPVIIVFADKASSRSDTPIARIRLGDGSSAALYDAFADGPLATVLLESIARRRKLPSLLGEVQPFRNREFRRLWGGSHPNFEPKLLAAASVDTTIQLGDRFVLKLFRQVESGIHPSVEMGQYLTEVAHFEAAPPYVGSMELQAANGEPTTLAVLHGFVPNDGNGWQVTRARIRQFILGQLKGAADVGALANTAPTGIYSLDFLLAPAPPIASELIGNYLPLAAAMGKRTAELDLTLASNVTDPGFAPEPFNDFYRQMLYHANVSLTSRRLEFLRQRYSQMPEDLRPDADKILGMQDAIIARFRRIFDERVPSLRTRFHGALHLGEMLVRGDDIVFIGFEGDPHLHLSERRIKRCALRDVTSMLYSFGYAAQAVSRKILTEPENMTDRKTIYALARFWYAHVSAAFVRSYWEAARHAPYMPPQRTQQQILLDNYLLERALLDVRSDIEEHPEFAGLPLRVLLHLLGAA